MSDTIKHSDPISIPNQHSHSRVRSVSFSASSSSEDESNSPPLRTPASPGPGPQPRVNTVQTPLSPSTSPILSYFMSSPSKSTTTSAGFGSLGRGFAPKAQEPIMEEDNDGGSPILRHARRMSTSTGWPPRFNSGTAPSATPEQHERGVALLRRLSLGSAFVQPQNNSSTSAPAPPVPAAPAPVPVPMRTSSPPAAKQPTSNSVDRKKRRGSTLGVPGDNNTRPRRAPSPMGERILKGHFDGFN
ncbi:hypothetical protein EW145_g2404 [Phellinidium pouzarii]|uniref:Uncharacterized protein n=1 Tax=Phellinidium pouzarii TaxID=167371 RepID=A0A4S4LB81_9AGAM|nr:hypothetical protein EW145_g2404 [Phellinidium pouzarii]